MTRAALCAISAMILTSFYFCLGALPATTLPA
jgi:hypothetical protein